ncbi:class I SAM-dependent methyltransferase [Saccharomonospora azurea]|uniref:Methylase involved in ubiquinone/menaquinone biosynthesis n=1 Tax=Saccharomonospora azurea NA-128 TaxID=882081 RepID=H8GE47_9PSEU|nr:class I SAM-dependent methyltransferase [Saccharomonospora azurea]EHK89375.1 methyltransferase family protein [Saccharomonospora azurea SZMC 14600]EHY90929.1 methylase involved in ubiquinone/menaquinone biosynthesis [Saccharomonospora azurea NA-128]
MPFDHNDCYHPLLLRLAPPRARRALDVGCGTGRLARRLAARGLAVEAVDTAEDVVAVAEALGSPGPGSVVYRHADVTTRPLPSRHYDLITCVASLHHMPFATVTTLREALAPGGVLAVLGLAHPSTLRDRVIWHTSVPVNLLANAVVSVADRLGGGEDPVPRAPVGDWDMSLNDVRREAARLLPGSRVRVLPFWRYLLTYRRA